jgi:catechol 2,3-dioxygenase-like lactoylglutathione lyase family enzyme
LADKDYEVLVPKGKSVGTPTNPLAARNHIFTIVTPDLEASIRFYRDLMGYELLRQGKLAGRLPTVAGAGEPGRRYALIRAYEKIPSEKGIIRLLEAPSNAVANRPRPGASIMDPGLAVLECLSGDCDESYRKLTEAGIKTVSRPLYYTQTGVKALPGASERWDTKDIEIRTFSAFGPGGEQMFISTGISLNHQPWPKWEQPGLHGPFVASVILTLDRWPLFDFYTKALGLKPTKDQYAAQETLNSLIGAPPDTYYRFGNLGEEVTIEWWEYRQRKPAATPPFPTNLDRTGLAMSSILVDDLAPVRAMLKEAGINPIGEGALPTPEAESRDGIYLRGPVGELIEIIGRKV